MPKKRVVVTFPKSLVGQPNIYRLIKDYDLVVNILRAQILPEEEGKVVMELEGTKENIEMGLKYLRQQAVSVTLLGRDIEINKNKCVDCGACTAVCTSKALSLDKGTWELKFNRDKCVLCGLCVPACPLRVINVTF